MLMHKEQASLLVVDIQEKLAPAVVDAAGMAARCRWLISVAADHGLPVVFSEQYPRGLGHTLPELLAQAPDSQVVEKTHFSCVAANCLPETVLLRPQTIVCGMEAHVCVLQTVLELLELDKQVFVVADAVSSRKVSDIELGLQRMRDAGAVIVSKEMVLFECLRQAGGEHFKRMSQRYLVGEQP